MNRRHFLQHAMAGTAAFALFPSMGAAAQSTGEAAHRLSIAARTLDINGKAARVFGLAQPDGTQGLTLEAGGTFDVALANTIDAPTLIHWHGLTPPWQQDGVPDNPVAMLDPSQMRRYTFPAGPGGTHWMHAHTLQEQNLLAAPLVVRTSEDMKRDEQEVVILLHDFSFTPAEELLARLKGSPAAGGMKDDMKGDMGQMSSGQMHHNMPGHDKGDMSMPGMGGMDMSAMGMGAMDLNDIEYDAYLANDRTLDDPQVVAVEKGAHVRLRIINGASATAFTIDTGRLPGELIAVDGRAVQPVAGRSFPVSMGQRLDIRLSLPRGSGSYPILALREGAKERAGIILATPGATIAKVPVLGKNKGPVLGLDLEQRLRALSSPGARPADRRYALALTGTMAGYSWGFDKSEALSVKQGERIEITMRNMSMMAHPMHLHGHHFQVTGINGKSLAGAMRDTVLVPPMASVTIAFDADNPGRWPLHCHHLYHMVTGMMTHIGYEGIG